MKLPRVLIIAGSDSGGGAGIQADLKAVAAMGGHATFAITAITAQNTLGVQAVHDIPAEMVARQFKSIIDDIGLDAAKTGMLSSEQTIALTAELLSDIQTPIVVDPVMVAKGGHRLIAAQAESALKQKLLPLASLVTPNLDEAEVLLGYPVREPQSMRKAAYDMVNLGARAALIKGGHLTGDEVLDVLFDGRNYFEFSSPRIHTQHTHGTGCTLASACATLLAQGWDMAKAVERARQLVRAGILNHVEIGAGHSPVHALADLGILKKQKLAEGAQ